MSASSKPSLLFYLENDGLENIDFRDPHQGNPGVGATEYMTVAIALGLKSRGLNVQLASSRKGNFPTILKPVVTDNLITAAQIAANQGQIFVTRVKIGDNSEVLKAALKFEHLKIVLWFHLQPNDNELTRLSNCPSIRAIICLGHNQKYRLLHHPISQKAVVINYPIIGIEKDNHSNQKPDPWTVVYIGSLTPQKGFHYLADAWPYVLSKIPDARLKVVGGGNLYDRRSSLGFSGIASKEYEERIFRKLNRNEKSVEFMGTLAENEKRKVIRSSSLGVVNPSGSTETFCLSAVEIQAQGVPVLAINKHGLRDTVHKIQGNFSFLRTARLGRNIVHALRTIAANSDRVQPDVITERYNFQVILLKWIDLTSKVQNNQPIILKSQQDKVTRCWLDIIRILNGKFRAWSRYKLPSIHLLIDNLEKLIIR